MEEFFQAGFAVDEVRQHNQAVLKKLKRRQEWLQFLCYVLVFGGAAGFTLFSPSLLVALPPIAALLGRLQTTSQRVILIEQLIESFQEEGIKRRKKKVRETIERSCLSRYGMQKQHQDSWEYELTFFYQDEQDFDKQVEDLLAEMDSEADLECCFIEADVTEIGIERSW